jgi:hypothetical protein
MSSKTAILASARLLDRQRSSSSHSKVAKKRSVTALTRNEQGEVNYLAMVTIAAIVLLWLQ